MAVPQGWVEDRRHDRSVHDRMVAHIRRNPTAYAEAAGFPYTCYMGEVTISPERHALLDNARVRCEYVIEGCREWYPDVLLFPATGKLESWKAFMVFEVKSYPTPDFGPTMRQIGSYLHHCPRAFGCLVVPSEYGLEAENPFLDEFRQEGVAVVSSGLVEYRADKGWDAPFACDELRANISALMVWANDRGMRE